MNAIEINNLTKIYKLYPSPKDRLKEILGGKKHHRDFCALNGVSFNVEQGQTVGIIGRNGSGKSTLLKIICGVIQPTCGSVKVNGRISSLLELGAGFNPEFTGRENVYMNGALMGLSRKEMERRLPDIEAFADIGEFIEQPVKTYSSGMQVRLAFAAAISVDPTILVIDEALAVGDIQFKQKCMLRFSQFQKEGKTILLVSHDHEAVKAVCETAVFLKQGSIAEIGKAGAVVDRYLIENARSSSPPLASQTRSGTSGSSNHLQQVFSDKEAVDAFQKKKFFVRFGTGAVRIKLAQLTDESGQPVTMAEFGRTINLNVLIETITPCPRLTVAFYVKDRNRLGVIGTNSDYQKMPVSDIQSGEVLLYQFALQLWLKQGVYTITVILANGPDNRDYYDWIEDAVSFEVLRSERTIHALYSPPVEVSITRQ
jgi:homopolymeric O-antigen transport system ATP-binding protein